MELELEEDRNTHIHSYIEVSAHAVSENQGSRVSVELLFDYKQQGGK